MRLYLVVAFAIMQTFCGYAAEDNEAPSSDILARTGKLIGDAENRYHGYPGNIAISNKIGSIFKEAGVPCGTTEYEAPVFIPGEAWLTVNGRRIRMYALLPNTAELSNFNSRDFSGSLFYVGNGDASGFKGKNLQGSLCLFDFDCGLNYLNAIKFGAAGCIFIEPEAGAYSPCQAYEKVLSIPFTVPRYQVSKSDGMFLKENAAGDAGVIYHAEVERNKWERKTLTNHWALVAGTDPEAKRELIILHTNLDSMNYCPELPSGSQNAINLQLLLDLFEKYRKNPPKRSMFFQVFNSSCQYQTGVAESVFHIFGKEQEIFNTDPGLPSEERILQHVKAESLYILNRYPALAPGKIAGLITEKYLASRDINAAASFADKLVGHDNNGDLAIWKIMNADGELLRKYPDLMSSDSIEKIIADSANAKENADVKQIAATITNAAEKITQSVIADYRERRDMPADRTFPIIEPLIRKLELEQFRLATERGQLEHGDKKAIEDIAHQEHDVGTIVSLFNRFGSTLSYKDLDPRQRELLEKYRQQVVADFGENLAWAENGLRRLDDIRRIRGCIKEFHPILALGLHSTYNNKWLGITTALHTRNLDHPYNRFLIEKEQLGQGFINRVAELTLPIQEKYRLFWESGKSDSLIFKDAGPSSALPYLYQRIPSYDILSPYDVNQNLLSAYDSLEALDPAIVANKAEFLSCMIDRVISDQSIKDLLTKNGESKILWRTGSSGQIVTRIQDGSTLDEPKTVLGNALVVLPLERTPEDISALKGGVFTCRMAMSNVCGRAFVYSLPHGVKFHPELYGYDDNGCISYAVDLGSTAKKIDPTLNLMNGFKEYHLLAAFHCRKADLYDIFHPRTLQPIGSPIFQKAKGDSAEYYSFAGFPDGREARGYGLGCVFLPPEQRTKILFSNNVSLLNATPQDWKGKGYLAREMDRACVPVLASKDTSFLDGGRIELLNNSAITDQLMNDLHAKGETYLLGSKDEGVSSLDSLAVLQDHVGHYCQSLKAYGSIYGAYPVVRNTMTDMVKGVVFYLAVLIPFSFFLQRLLFNYTRIEAQLASFTAIFLISYALLQHVHPAFQIVSNPQVILIAFIMVVLAGFVSFVLKGKFDYHMGSFKERFSSEKEVGVLKLTGTAMLMGASNMKRRPLRTALTCVTVMLITFTMLSFTSISQRMEPTRIMKDNVAPYNGIFYSSQVWRALSQEKIDLLTNSLGNGHNVLLRAAIAYRVNEEATVLVEDQKQPMSIQGILGLQKKEDGWLEAIPVASGRFFSSDNAMEIMVTDLFAKKALALSEQSGRVEIPENTWLTINGLRLKLVGILDSAKMSGMRDLRGASIIPQLQITDKDIDNQERSFMEEKEVQEGSFRDVAPQYYVVLPIKTCAKLNVPIVSVSIKMPDAQSVWNSILEYVYYSDDKIYFAAQNKFALNLNKPKEADFVYAQPGRYYLGSGFSTSIGGLSSLLIPLLISATIIFNTMLGAVYERKREIGIFNSIGLNPIHIALFFISEAVVYGILGGVGGYLIGQVLAKFIVSIGLMRDINFNYSSLMVVYAIIFAILTVIASSLYPTLMAMRTAGSSSGRKKIEQCGDNELTVRFPYSFTREMGIAVNSYMKEYFDKHADSSVGDFLAKFVACKTQKVDGVNSLVLEYDISLAPYDLGVNQLLVLTTSMQKDVGAFMVCAEVIRTSGENNNWLATNHKFLNDIRKYLLHWRVLSSDGQKNHLAEGLRLFGETED